MNEQDYFKFRKLLGIAGIIITFILGLTSFETTINNIFTLALFITLLYLIKKFSNGKATVRTLLFFLVVVIFTCLWIYTSKSSI